TVLRSFTQHLQPLRETLRLLGEQQAAAEETEQALAALPKQTGATSARQTSWARAPGGASGD
ncbi:MAG: hypothetical protein ACRDSL_27650, partial [Pseudonocardiaceae bacterium]